MKSESYPNFCHAANDVAVLSGEVSPKSAPGHHVASKYTSAFICAYLAISAATESKYFAFPVGLLLLSPTPHSATMIGMPGWTCTAQL